MGNQIEKIVLLVISYSGWIESNIEVHSPENRSYNRIKTIGSKIIKPFEGMANKTKEISNKIGSKIK